MELTQIKEHWESWAKEFGTDLRATTKTPTIKKLEIKALVDAIKNSGIENGTILEAGCGNGINSIALLQEFSTFTFTGLDYVQEMVDNANKLKQEKQLSNISFVQGNILELETNSQLEETYDIIFTDRVIINLNTAELQLKAFDQLVKKLKPNGLLLILENSQQTYDKQNSLRTTLGMEPRTPASYNIFLDEEKFLEHAERSVKLIHIDDFGSLHDLLLYVLVPYLNNGQTDYDHPIVKAATDLLLKIPNNNQFSHFGQNRLFVFRK